MVEESHTLQTKWTFYIDSPKEYKGKQGKGEQSWVQSKPLGHCATIGEFWQLANNVPSPSQLPHGSNYLLFKHHIKPSWEHPCNSLGGKWMVYVSGPQQHKTLDALWQQIQMACIGEQFGADAGQAVCGCLAQVRASGVRIVLWTMSAMDCKLQLIIGRRLRELLEPIATQFSIKPLAYEYVLHGSENKKLGYELEKLHQQVHEEEPTR